MTTVSQEQLSAVARSIAERAEQGSMSSDYDAALSDLKPGSAGHQATLAQQLIDLRALFAAERNLQHAVVERLEREVAVIRGELAAIANERAENLAQIDRLNRETRQAIDAMMAQIISSLEARS